MLTLAEVRKRFGPVQALDSCSFSVDRGRMLGFLGPNGAGKTTTMRAVFGLVQLDGGEVLWDGRPVGLEERLRFGYMPEERGLYPRMGVGEQLAYFGRLHGLSANAARAAWRLARRP
jgi:ABC-2 type transport system ATP-binding protein